MKKILMFLAAAMLLLGMSRQALAYFQDSQLIRVVYDRGGNYEVVTDLGSGWDLTLGYLGAPVLLDTNNFSLSDLGISDWDNVYVAYFMRDAVMGANQAWTSGNLISQTAANRQFSAYVTAYGNLSAYNQPTLLPQNVNPQDLPLKSYNMTMGEQGRFSSFLPLGTTSPGDQLLDSFNQPGIQYVDQFFYYYSDPNAGGTGYTVFKIRTWEDGTTEIYPVPIPPAVYLLGSGLLGLIGIRRRMMA